MSRNPAAPQGNRPTRPIEGVTGAAPAYPGLYRFMRCDTTERLNYVRELLENRRLKYSAVTAFNDPFEARPYIRIPGGSHEEQIAAFLKHLDDVKRVAASVPLAPELTEYVQAGELEKARDLFQESIRIVLSGHPVACLAGTRRSTLMWSPYADSHRGVCVHFSGRIEPLRTASPIIYTDDYPSLGLDWARMTDDRAFSDICILTKSSQWRHEQEYRLISPIEGQDSEVIFEGDVGTLRPGSVTGLTLGALMRDDVADCLTATARSAGLAVWRARRSDHEYRLMFERLNLQLR